jgi:quercetin dioxygenase-like cupin family protein
MFTLSRTARTVTAPSLALALLAVASPVSRAQQRANLRWGPAPAVFPRGARMSVLSGDPARAGPYAVRLSMPHGYRVPPHSHPTNEHIIVRQGSLRFGTGDKMNRATRKQMRVLRTGESIDAQANMHHFVEASGPTEIEVSGQGPFAMTYVDPADDPQRRAMAKEKGTARKAKA